MQNLRRQISHPRQFVLTFVLVMVLVTTFLYQQVVLKNVLVPDSVTWNGDETWLMQEFRTQATTGHFRYPEALGSTVEIGSGIIFNNMWVTAALYGLPYALVGHSHIVIGRMISSIIAALLLTVLYKAGRRLKLDRPVILGSLIILIETDSFTYSSHSARYDILSSLTIILGLLLLIHILEKKSPYSDYLLGAAFPASLLISPHVILCLGPAIGLTILLRSVQSGSVVVIKAIGGAIAMAGLILMVYALFGNDDWSLTGPAELGRYGLPSSSGYLPIIHRFDLSYLANQIAKRLVILKYYALPLELSLGLAFISVLILRPKIGDLLHSKTFMVGLVLLSFYMLETHDVHALIYITPVLVLVLMIMHCIISKRSALASMVLIVLPVVITLPIFYVRGERASRMAESIVESSKAAYAEVRRTIGPQLGHTLIDSHGMTYLIEANELRPMADIFDWHSSTGDSIATVLASNGVQHVIRLKAFGKEDGSSYRRHLDNYLDNHTVELKRFIGPFSDYRVSYRTGHKEGLDTIVVALLK